MIVWEKRLCFMLSFCLCHRAVSRYICDNNIRTSEGDETEWMSKKFTLLFSTYKRKAWRKKWKNKSLWCPLYDSSSQMNTCKQFCIQVKNVFNCFSFEWMKIIFIIFSQLQHQVHVNYIFALKMNSSTYTVCVNLEWLMINECNS